ADCEFLNRSHLGTNLRLFNQWIMWEQNVSRQSMGVGMSVGVAPLCLMVARSYCRRNANVHRNHVFPGKHIQSDALTNILNCVLYLHEGERTSHASTNVKLQWTDYSVLDLNPRAVADLHRLSGRIGSTLGGAGGLFIGAPLKSGKGSIENQNNETNDFCRKLYIVEPIPLFLAGCFLTCWGWWRIRFSREGCWRDLWTGLASMLIGWPIASIGLGIFFLRI